MAIIMNKGIEDKDIMKEQKKAADVVFAIRLLGEIGSLAALKRIKDEIEDDIEDQKRILDELSDQLDMVTNELEERESLKQNKDSQKEEEEK